MIDLKLSNEWWSDVCVRLFQERFEPLGYRLIPPQDFIAAAGDFAESLPQCHLGISLEERERMKLWRGELCRNTRREEGYWICVDEISKNCAFWRNDWND